MAPQFAKPRDSHFGDLFSETVVFYTLDMLNSFRLEKRPLVRTKQNLKRRFQKMRYLSGMFCYRHI